VVILHAAGATLLRKSLIDSFTAGFQAEQMAEFRADQNASATTRLRVLIVTDGKMGDLAQCRGVAGALGTTTAEITVKPSALAAMFGSSSGDSAFHAALTEISDPPDVVLASGRRAAPYLKTIKKRWGEATLTVFLKDPRTGRGTADLIWVPEHDRLRGANVITTATGPHGHTAARRAKAASNLRAQLTRYPRPWLGVLLGGASKRVTYEQATIDRLVDALRAGSEGAGSILITPSRRTPPALTEALAAVHRHIWVWDGTGDNPYPGMLGACDAFLVTGDSHNMVSEALAAGRHTMVFRPAGLPKKFTRFLDSMEREGTITAPGPADFTQTQPPIDATPVIADAIRARLKDWR
jgi:mitochondrial fission protein ELM1